MNRHGVKFGLTLIPVALTMIMLASGCGGGKSRLTVQPDESLPPSTPELSGVGYNHFVNANLLEVFGAYGEALREYQNALNYFPESAIIRTDYARLLFRLSRIPEALEQAILIEPKNAEVYLLIGDCYRLTDKIETAIAYYRKSVELDPENINAFWYLAGYYQQEGMDDSLISTYYHLARLSDTYRIWNELGTVLGRTARYAEALDAFIRAVELNPDKNNINAYLGLATTYEALDSISRAEEIFQQAVELAPDDVRIYRQMLMMYLNRQDVEKSIETSETLVALVPSDWLAQRRLGVLLYTDGQLERADSLFADRLEYGDDHVLNYFYRGRVALEQNRLNEGKEYFLIATTKDPTFIDSWLNLGFIYSQLDSLGRAVDMARGGLASATDQEDSLRMTFALGAALERNGQFYEAIEVFKSLVARDEQNAPALNYLGYMLADRGEQLTYAMELIERALEISPDNGAYIDSYAWVHFRLGNYQEALTQLKKAVDLLSDDAVIYEHLGDVYKALGNRVEAERHYRRALEIDPDSISIEEKLKE